MSELSAPTSRDEFSYLPPYVAPHTKTQKKLAEIWRQTLGLDRIGISDSFEDIGGSSLIAAAIFAEIEKVFAVKVEMITLIQAATIEELAFKVEGLMRAAAG